MSAHVEEARIARLRALFAAGPSAPEVEVDIGDDAAVLAHGEGRLVLSVDAHVEGVHFDRRWLSLDEIGARAANAALSDLAAMGARPHVVLLSLALPPALSEEELEALARGVRRGCDEAGARVIGGNLTRAQELSLHTTVLGRAREATLERRGARVGDALYVTGTLGEAALGLEALRQGRAEEPRFAPYVQRWRRPRARVDVGPALVGVATSAMDVSDGLAIDLVRLAAASSVGIAVEATSLPCSDDFAASARSLGCDPVALALGGGEDYELVFTASPGAAVMLQGRARRIGEVVSVPGLHVSGEGGRPIVVSGFDHFRARSED